MGMVIAFHGKAGAGKSTCSALMEQELLRRGFEVRRMRFAGPVYELHDMIQGYMAQFGYEPQTKHRALLQRVGTEIGRDLYGPSVWADITAKAAQKFFDASPSPLRAVIIDDMRFPEELTAMKSMKGAKNYVYCVSLRADEDVRRARADQWPADPSHRSETGLDHVGVEEFNLTIDTGAYDQEQVREILVSDLIERDARPTSQPASDTETRLQTLVHEFNARFRVWEETSGCGANFKWEYDPKGNKNLAILDIGPREELTENSKRIAASVGPAMELAESLVKEGSIGSGNQG